MAHQFEEKWRSQDVQLMHSVDFSALLLKVNVLRGLNEAGFKKPSPIQLEAIPIGRFGKDLLVQAKSGTGKTLVFTIVALEMLKPELHHPQVLILTPTREIATQICSVVKSVGSSFPKLTCNCFIGGLPMSDDKEKSLTSQIVVGTPGRIRELIEEDALPTKFVRLLVFDEADKLLEDNFKLQTEDIFDYLPEDKQVIATSASYPNKLANRLTYFMKKPHKVCLNSEEPALLAVVHYGMLVKYSPMPIQLYRNKLEALERVLKTIKFAQCLVFCNGIHRVEVLYRDIEKWGFSATYISSAIKQFERLEAIDKLKNFMCKVLVTSDLTARGIDAENVDLVINFDLCHSIETYLHRVGRAGRYGSTGVAITIVDENEVKYLKWKEEDGSFKVYKLPDPVPRNLIQRPAFGEYFIEDSEPLKEHSSVNSSVKRNSSVNSSSLSKLSSDVRSSSSSHSGDFDSCSSSSSESSCSSSSSKSSCSSSSSENSCSSSSSESDCSSCSSELLTYSDTAKYRHARKQKKFFASRHHKRPTRNNWQQFPRPLNNLRKHHYQPVSRQGYSQQPLVYQEIPTNRECCCRCNFRPHQYQSVCRRGCSLQSPGYEELSTNREYQRYTASNTHKAKNHRHRSKSSKSHACSVSCFLPSQHRYYPGHRCGYGPACLQWYQMFCNQWQELQNLINFFWGNAMSRY